MTYWDRRMTCDVCGEQWHVDHELPAATHYARHCTDHNHPPGAWDIWDRGFASAHARQAAQTMPAEDAG